MVGSRSVLILDGDEHRRERRLLLPSFQGNHVRRYGDLMREVVEEEIGHWPLGRPFPLPRFRRRLRCQKALESSTPLSRRRKRLPTCGGMRVGGRRSCSW